MQEVMVQVMVQGEVMVQEVMVQEVMVHKRRWCKR